MPEAVVNTSPLQYLFQAGLLDLLPKLYSGATVPEAVSKEIEAGRSLGIMLPVLSELKWLKVQRIRRTGLLALAVDLGPGEREVLALATELPDVVAVLDDTLARQSARLLGIRYTGTLGVLLKAKAAGHLSRVSPALEKLQDLGFHLDPGTRTSVIRLAGE